MFKPILDLNGFILNFTQKIEGFSFARVLLLICIYTYSTVNSYIFWWSVLMSYTDILFRFIYIYVVFFFYYLNASVRART